MTEPEATDPAARDESHPQQQPSRRDRLQPLELIGFSAVLSVFAALVIMIVLPNAAGTLDLKRAGIVAGIVFIVCLVTLALIGLGGKPSEADEAARKDLRKQQRRQQRDQH